VPRYFLFGEPPHEADERFFHVETIADRSRLYDWTIRAHAHRDLHQLLVLLEGGAEIRLENPGAAIRAPALLFVPAGTVHAFQFERDTRGYVVTMAITQIDELARREPALRSLFDSPSNLAITRSALEELELEDALKHLHREFLWSARARVAAAEARLVTVLVAALRAVDERQTSAKEHRGPRAALVARFRRAIETNFRDGWPVNRYAKALGVTPSKLRSACLEVTAKAPTRLLHDRLILEAKRNLLYTHMTIAEAAYDLGFSDPAYFSRFFSERVGESPAAFRRRR
jgi:AraC family transcriptional activator of pobA